MTMHEKFWFYFRILKRIFSFGEERITLKPKFFVCAFHWFGAAVKTITRSAGNLRSVGTSTSRSSGNVRVGR